MMPAIPRAKMFESFPDSVLFADIFAHPLPVGDFNRMKSSR
jgi:hypothetical protein